MTQVEQPATGQQQDDGATDSLSFLDLFYAVPVADLAVRVGTARIDRVTAADWSTMAVEVAVLLFSWVGLHLNRSLMAQRTAQQWFISNLQFRSARFLQFCLEVVITGLYFVIGLTLALPQQSGSPPAHLPSERWVLGTLLAVWFTYVVWDQLDVQIAGAHRNPGWQYKAKVGRNVSLVFLLLFGAMFAIECAFQATRDHSILVWNLLALVVLYVYRTTQQWAKDKWTYDPLLCRRCGRPVGVSAAQYKTFKQMHYVCFHYEFQHHPEDPDQECKASACPSAVLGAAATP
jgi:hypothetical protein